MKFRKMMGVTAAFLCAALALSGCGSTDETAYRICIVQQDEHSSLDAATQGFEDKLMELLGKSPKDIRDAGVHLSFVPEDRLGMGLVGPMDIVDNIAQTAVDENQKPTEAITIHSVSIETYQ